MEPDLRTLALAARAEYEAKMPAGGAIVIEAKGYPSGGGRIYDLPAMEALHRALTTGRVLALCNTKGGAG